MGPTLAAAELLRLWDRGAAVGRFERVLTLAEATGADRDDLVDSPLGHTHERALHLRERLLGRQLSVRASCPGCAEQVEFTLDTQRLRDGAAGRAPDAPADDHDRVAGRPGPAEAAATSSMPDAWPDAAMGGAMRCGASDGCSLVWRPPTPADVLAAAAEPEPEAALWRRCLRVTGPDGPLDPLTLDETTRAAVEAAMAEADPLAMLLVAVSCPSCGVDFEADVDPGAFVWAEVEAAAVRLLHDVDLLARAYGWTEQDVLALSDPRRAAYARLASGGVP